MLLPKMQKWYNYLPRTPLNALKPSVPKQFLRCRPSCGRILLHLIQQISNTSDFVRRDLYGTNRSVRTFLQAPLKFVEESYLREPQYQVKVYHVLSYFEVEITVSYPVNRSRYGLFSLSFSISFGIIPQRLIIIFSWPFGFSSSPDGRKRTTPPESNSNTYSEQSNSRPKYNASKTS